MRGTPDLGVLIAIEGIDGAGKTTQVQLLADALRGAGEEVVTSKEPTNGTWGRKIKESATSGRMPIDEEIDAFIRDREEHVHEKIDPSLADDKIVILDRYLYSTIAYQGSRGADRTLLERRMKEWAPVPHAVLVLDLDPRVALERIARRDEKPNAFENLANLSLVRKAFREMSAADPVIHEVDGAAPIIEVHRTIVQRLLDGPLKAARCAKAHGCSDPVHCIPRITGACRWASLYGKIARRLALPPLPAARARA